MLQELSTAHYDLIRPLFTPLDHYLAVESVLAGNSPGKVWADQPLNPQTAVIWINHRTYLVRGTATSSALAAFFSNQFQPAARDAGIDGMTMHVIPDEMDVAALFPDTYPQQRPRFYFRQDARQLQWEYDVPDGFTLRPVNASLLRDTSIHNLDFVSEEMTSERPTITDFLNRSFGYCLVHKAEIVGWCMSEYNTGTRCELGIAVTDAFQRSGLATLLATAVIRHALSIGIYDIGWLCWQDNLASIATANKLGFQQVAADSAHVIMFDPAIALGVQAMRALRDGRFAAAVDLHTKAIQQDDPPAWIYWNRAVTYVKLEQKTAAFLALHQAIDAGFDQWDFLQTSPHWRIWHAAPEWQLVLQRIPAQQKD